MAEVQVLYAATANGLVQLASPGTSHRWRPIGDALQGQDVLAVRASAVDPLLAYAGTIVGLHVTRDGGATWELQREGSVTALAAADDGAIYAGTDRGVILRVAADGGNEVHAGDARVVSLSVQPSGRAAAVYESGKVDIFDGEQWKPAGLMVPCATELVYSKTDPDEFYFGSEKGIVTRLGAHTVDGAPIFALLLLAGKPEVLLLGLCGSVQRSEDRGNTLTPVEGPAGVRVLVSPPRYQDYAYAGTEEGELWLSSDRGRTWRKLHAGMGAVRDLSFARVR
jgi:hypothetical protein